MVNLTINELIRHIAPNDEMFDGTRIIISISADPRLKCISCSLHAARLQAHDVRRILDLPCGHGCVLRYLRAAFPGAEITACDLVPDGVDYCAKTFGAIPVYSKEDPSQLGLERNAFDLIWVGSLLTHLNSGRCADFLDFFCRALRPGGILVFSTHGREAYDRARRRTFDYGLPYWRATLVMYAYERNGFGYADYLNSNSYGVTLSSPDWVFNQIALLHGMRLVHFSEKAWDGHHDICACVRDSSWQVDHTPISTLTFVKHTIRERVRPRR